MSQLQPLNESRIPDESPVNPLQSISQSVLLSQLPIDASTALQEYSADSQKVKIKILFKAVGATKMLKQPICTVSSTQRFDIVGRWLRKQLQCSSKDSLFLYVNSAFAPAPDEIVGNLYKCFKVADQLVINYCTTPAFG
ncbi:Ubiquitin-like protein ATG12 [Neolecta irregularis DAH-3]|uniref:Ubiquitin-like protein ATG12 n=1 Tax=Neolecta irregularis (strain DAH-3) TaxID=1198029 RepID=A0A1U7LMX9_NEOID|nr:Ubiquitin-like protein ATG12 [Neolecta irregularis DAH-3]|eukprot:OLL23999.1 Ubiquitin-like protein ATG12 [Neolecta irregularis DAH-3]